MLLYEGTITPNMQCQPNPTLLAARYPVPAPSTYHPNSQASSQTPPHLAARITREPPRRRGYVHLQHEHVFYLSPLYGTSSDGFGSLEWLLSRDRTGIRRHERLHNNGAQWTTRLPHNQSRCNRRAATTANTRSIATRTMEKSTTSSWLSLQRFWMLLI